MKKKKVTWGEVDKMCASLAEKIAKEYSPDLLVGISRGGLVPVRLLSDLLKVKNVEIVRASFYTEPGKTKQGVELNSVNFAVEGNKVLLVDDVADTGKTLLAVKSELEKRSAVVKTATLHFKRHSVIVPDFYFVETSEWLVYPWDKTEHEV